MVLRVDVAVVNWLQPDRKANLRALVRERRFTEAAEAAELTLERWPLDPTANFIHGVSTLYSAISTEVMAEEMGDSGDTDGTRMTDDEDLFATAVVSLRRALLDSAIKMGEPAAQYAIGKAYFHRGYFYYDLAVHYLEQSLVLGYAGTDTYEYLGLAYTALGDSRGLDSFRQALSRRPSGLLHLKIATMLLDQGDLAGARENLIQAIDITGEVAIAQRARYELGAIYRLLGELSMAAKLYRDIIAVEARSADAYFYLGEVYALQGNFIRAREEWRAARDLDANHFQANERLR